MIFIGQPKIEHGKYLWRMELPQSKWRNGATRMGLTMVLYSTLPTLGMAQTFQVVYIVYICRSYTPLKFNLEEEIPIGNHHLRFHIKLLGWKFRCRYHVYHIYLSYLSICSIYPRIYYTSSKLKCKHITYSETSISLDVKYTNGS